MDQNLQGKVALVTGATSGLGLEASAGLAARGMKIIFAVRNAKKAEKVANEIRAKVPQAKLLYPPEVPAVDFQDNDSIRTYVKAILERNEPLAVLINNAGTSKLPNEKTKDGVASLAQANYLGPWLLTHLLEPLLVSSKSRVVFVSSMTARSCVITNPHTFLTSWWHSWYKHTKLAECFNAFELQRRLGAQGVTVATLDPGGVNTAIWTNTVFSSFPIKQVIQEVYAPAEEAAEIIIYAATVPWEVDAEPGVPPEEDLRFYARGLCASPLVCNVDGSWSTWTSTPKWSMWGASAITHTLLDYPLRHRSGRRLCARIQRVPAPHQAYDKKLAKDLWSLSEKFTGSTATPLASPQQLPQEFNAPMSRGKGEPAPVGRQDMEPSSAAAGAELGGDAIAEVRPVPVGAGSSKPVAKPDAQGRGEGQEQEQAGQGMGQGAPHPATSGAVRPAVQVGPPGPETTPETSTAAPKFTTKAVPSLDDLAVQPTEGGTAATGKAGPNQGTEPGHGERDLVTDIIDRSAAAEIQPVAGESITSATFADSDAPATGTEPATAVEAAATEEDKCAAGQGTDEHARDTAAYVQPAGAGTSPGAAVETAPAVSGKQLAEQPATTAREAPTASKATETPSASKATEAAVPSHKQASAPEPSAKQATAAEPSAKQATAPEPVVPKKAKAAASAAPTPEAKTDEGAQTNGASAVMKGGSTASPAAAAAPTPAAQPQTTAPSTATTQPARSGASSAGGTAGGQQQGSKTTTSGSTGSSSKKKGKGKKK